MKRVLEPELMQDLLQVQAYAEADFSESDNSLIKRIEEILDLESKQLGSKSLIGDLGCGPGNITERLSSRWPFSNILGIDGSEAMLAVARQRKNHRETYSRINYCCCDLGSIVNRSIVFEKAADLIVSNSLLHHLHDPSYFWKALKHFTAQGTVYLHRDLRRPSSMDEAIALQKKYLPDAPKVLINDYLASLQAAFTVSEVEVQLESQGLEQLRVCENDDRYLEIFGSF